MFLSRKVDPESFTKSVIDTFDDLTEEEIAKRTEQLRRQSPESEEIELLEAMRVSKDVSNLNTVTELEEHWFDAWNSLEEVWHSPNRASVKSLLGKLYRQELDNYLEVIVVDAKAQLKTTVDHTEIVSLLGQIQHAIYDTTCGFGDLPGIGRLDAKWWNKLKKKYELARSHVRVKEREAERELKRQKREQSKGRCNMCGNSPRVLTALDNGQLICRTCLRVVRPPRPKHLATLKQIEDLRRSGMTVSNELTKDHARVLGKVVAARNYGLSIREGASEDEIDAAINSRPVTIDTKVAGVSFPNEDGTSRQRILRKCSPGESLLLIRDPKNEYDCYAVKVCKRSWFRRSPRQIGFLCAWLAETIAPLMDSGVPVQATVEKILEGGGSFWSREPYGLSIQISYPR